MLRLRDCVTGESVEYSLSEAIPSGHFALLTESTLGSHGRWPAGTILLDDGRGYIDVEGEHIGFITSELDAKSMAKRDIAFQALEEIRGLGDLRNTESLPSPVIPAEISHRFEPSPLQIELQDTLRLGHLHIITKSPRISMRYDEELLPVSRVKRTANNYQRYLAAHSECWQQRTFSGILPKKLQAKVSEDEIYIYENRVFARLLDYLERYIKSLLARLYELGETLRQGLELNTSDSLHRSLRKALCVTWGETFKLGEAEALESHSGSQLTYWGEQLKSIQQMKQSATYRAIPRDAGIPLALKNTNILMNDPHYTKVRRLWELWVKEVAAGSRDYEQIFKLRQSRAECYRHYIGLLLLRAHGKMGWEVLYLSGESWVLTHPSGVVGKLSQNGSDWQLSCEHSGFTGLLSFVPIIDILPTFKAVDDRVMCCLNWLGKADGVINCSPDDLFTEESVIEVVQQWWMKLFASNYGVKILNLPRAVLEKWPESHPEGLFSAIHHDALDIHAWINVFSLSPMIKATLQRRYFAAKAMTYCPCCGRQSARETFLVREDKGFKASCNICSAVWEIRSTGCCWVYDIGFGFKEERAGRWCQVITLAL